jgi:hypothetical protein
VQSASRQRQTLGTWWAQLLNQIAAIHDGGGAAGGTTSYESIATVTPSGTGQVTFSSIPSTYKHLQVRGIYRNSANVGGDDARLRLNNDSSAIYITHRLYGLGSGTPTANTSGTGDTSMQFGYNTADGSTGADIFTGCVIDILDYASTNKNKTVRTLDGFDNNGSGSIQFLSGLYVSTNAITRLDLYCFNLGSNNWATGTTFALYGIKG